MKTDVPYLLWIVKARAHSILYGPNHVDVKCGQCHICEYNISHQCNVMNMSEKDICS